LTVVLRRVADVISVCDIGEDLKDRVQALRHGVIRASTLRKAHGHLHLGQMPRSSQRRGLDRSCNSFIGR